MIIGTINSKNPYHLPTVLRQTGRDALYYASPAHLSPLHYACGKNGDMICLDTILCHYKDGEPTCIASHLVPPPLMCIIAAPLHLCLSSRLRSRPLPYREGHDTARRCHHKRPLGSHRRAYPGSYNDVTCFTPPLS